MQKFDKKFAAVKIPIPAFNVMVLTSGSWFVPTEQHFFSLACCGLHGSASFEGVLSRIQP